MLGSNQTTRALGAGNGGEKVGTGQRRRVIVSQRQMVKWAGVGGYSWSNGRLEETAAGCVKSQDFKVKPKELVSELVKAA